MTKQKHVISKKGILWTSRAQRMFPGFLLLEQRDEQSVMGQSVCLFTSARHSCSAQRYQSTTAHWAHPNLPWEVWSYDHMIRFTALITLHIPAQRVYWESELTACRSAYKLRTYALFNWWLTLSQSSLFVHGFRPYSKLKLSWEGGG